MQIIKVSSETAIILCFVVWLICQVGAALLARALPEKCFRPSSFLFRPRAWEKEGQTYRRLFAVHRWKKYLPDGGAVGRNGFRKKKLQTMSIAYLERFLVESCRGEFTHLLAILPFWIFGLFTPPGVVWLMLLYALMVNLPCIIAQRYNRPRMMRIIDMKKR